MKKLLFSFAVLLIFASSSLAAGFGLYEYSSRGTALGGTLTARADDPSALAYNPAGITQIEGNNIMFGLTTIRPALDVVIGGKNYGNERTTWVPPHFYYTKQLNDKYWLGLSLMSRFGLGSEFKKDWPGRYNNYETCIRSVSFSPSLAMKVSDSFSFSLGAEAMWFEFEQNKKVPPGKLPFDPALGQLDASLLGDDIGWGWNLGLHFRPTEKFRLGFFYRSEVDQEV